MRFYWTVGYMGDELVCIKSPVQANCPFTGPRDVNSLLYFTIDEAEQLSRLFTRIEKGKTLDWFKDKHNWREFLLEALGKERYQSYLLAERKAEAIEQSVPVFKNMGFFIPGGVILGPDGKRPGDDEPPPKFIFNPNE